MSQKTTNYQLTKPAPEDFVDVGDLNDNFDALDTALKSVADTAEAALPTASYTGESILTKLKTVDGTDSGLDADLFKGSSTVAIANGGTGATTAADARNNLGAVSKAGDTMTGTLRISSDDYASLSLNSTSSGKKLLIQQSPTSTSFYTYTTDTDNTNFRRLAFLDAGNQSDVADALRLTDVVNGAYANYKVLTEANVTSVIQSLLQRGSISVVKSIQKGTYHNLDLTDLSEENGMAYVDVTINSINTNKAFLIVNAGTYTAASNGRTPNGKIINSTTIRLYYVNTSSSSSGKYEFYNYNWQVVEFY